MDRRVAWGVVVAGAASFVGGLLVLVGAVIDRNGAEAFVQVVAMLIGAWLVIYGGRSLRRRNGARRGASGRGRLQE